MQQGSWGWLFIARAACLKKPLPSWHNRGHQTTPFSKQSVTRLKTTGKNFPKNIQKQ